MDNGLQVFVQKVSIQAIQKSMGILSKKIDDINTVVADITQSLKTIATKPQLRQHNIVMEESLNTMGELNTGLTTAMDQYKFSDSTPLGGNRMNVHTVAGSSSKQPYVYPECLTTFLSPLVSSLRNTSIEYSWNIGLREGAGSSAGGADDEAAGGADGGGGSPPPPDPPPFNNGDRRMSRRRRRIKELEFAKSIKIKEPKKFFGKADEDFDTWWVLVQVYMKDQPERFPEDQRTIDWIGSLMESHAA
jgi:hypothetical protein